MVAEPRGRDTPWYGSREHISERIDKQVVDPWESQDQTLQSTVEQIHGAPVPEMIEQLMKLPKIVSVDRIQERIAEQTVDILVPQDVEEPAEFFKDSSLNRVQQSSAEQTVETNSRYYSR